MRGSLAALAALGIALSACSASSKTKGGTGSAATGSFTLFVTTEMKGQIEPCGCTSDPLGDLSRTAGLIQQARAGGPVLFLDGGSLLYTELPVSDARRAQEQLKAELVASAFRTHLDAAAIGLGPYDLGEGPGAVTLPRQAANVAKGIPVEAPKIMTAGGVKVGVFGVVDPSLVSGHGIEATDPVPAARAAVADLRKRGAQVVVGLIHMTPKDAKALLREVDGVDFAVAGAGAPEPEGVDSSPNEAGGAFLVQPANRGQVITRLDVTVRSGAGFVDAIGDARAKTELAVLDARIEALAADVAKFEADPNADADFVQTQVKELARMKAQRADLAANPLRVPDTGSWFTMTQVPIKKALPCDGTVQQQKVDYDAAVGKANLEAAKGTVAPPVAEGQAGYAGTEECGFCHQEAVDFWKTTRHAGAWKTLEDGGKQYNLECIYCHVTGFDKPGGSNLALLAEPPEDLSLRDVQCEVCHGPGSLHVDADGKETPSSLVLRPPEDTCKTCHNELHSDTFAYEAYLRDVLGEGHGAAMRKELGDGPTGHELRSAAKTKAGANIGKGCLK